MTDGAAVVNESEVPAAFEAEENEATQRKLTGSVATVARVAAILLPVLTLWCAFSGWWDAMTRAAGHLMFTVPLVFLYYPARRRAPISWTDIALASLSVVAFAWIVVNQRRLMWRMVYVDPLTWPDLILGVAAIALVLEATRRMIGWTLVITTLLFFVYALGGPWMPGALAHQGVQFNLLIDHLYLVPEGLFNVITGIMATYLFTFLLFASLLQVGGGREIIMDLAHALGSRFVGGPAKVAVVSSALMGTVSGSTVANVVTTGSVTIPLMKRYGFKAVEAAAIETAAGVGGAIMPPLMGAGVFIMSELTGIPLITLIGYAILPAILYFGSIVAYVHVKAAKRGLGRGAPSQSSVLAIVGRGFHLVAPLGVLVGLLIVGYTPFYASALGILVLIAVSFLRRETRITPAKLLTAFELTSRGALMLTVTSASAAVVMGIITSTGLMLKITSMTLALAQNSVFLGLVLVAVISFIVGMSLPTTMSYILVSTLAAPALADLGVPLIAAHLVIFWFAQDSTITPPVCTTAFVAASIAGSPPMRTGWETFRVAKALYIVPLLFVYSNLLSGNIPLMIYDAAAALVALAVLPAITYGYFRGPLSRARRVILAAGVAACFFATTQLSVVASLPWLVAGVLIIGIVYVWQRRTEASGQLAVASS